MNKEEKLLMFKILRIIYEKVSNREKIRVEDFGILKVLDNKIMELNKWR